jgi:hypothetical protein
MSPRSKFLLSALALFLVCALGTVVFSAVVADGNVVVKVHEGEGTSVNLTVPAVLAQLALWVVPDRLFAEMDPEAREWMPMARAAVKALGKHPDFTMVRVESRTEQVEVAVSQGCFVVRVEESDESVYVRVPLRLASTVLNKMERARGAGGELTSLVSS